MQGWLPSVLGFIGGTLSAGAFVPQVVKIWREGDTEAISVRMYVLRVTGFVLWLWYGFMIASTPLIVFNVLNVVLGGTVLWLTLKGAQGQGERTGDERRAAVSAAR